MTMIAPEGPVYQAGTLSGNPLAMSAGIAQVLCLREEEPLAGLELRARQLLAGLQDAAGELGVPLWGDAAGGMWGFHFADGPVRDFAAAGSADTALHARFFRACLARGVFLPPSSFEACFLSMSHGDEEIEHTLTTFRAALKEAVG